MSQTTKQIHYIGYINAQVTTVWLLSSNCGCVPNHMACSLYNRPYKHHHQCHVIIIISCGCVPNHNFLNLRLYLLNRPQKHRLHRCGLVPNHTPCTHRQRHTAVSPLGTCPKPQTGLTTVYNSHKHHPLIRVAWTSPRISKTTWTPPQISQRHRSTADATRTAHHIHYAFI